MAVRTFDELIRSGSSEATARLERGEEDRPLPCWIPPPRPVADHMRAAGFRVEVTAFTKVNR
jgi:hypothetical protein